MSYYDVLKVSKTANEKEIKKAYKLLVKQYHPDIYEGSKEYAENKIKEINEAYDVLSNKDSRKKYDESLHEINIETVKQDLENFRKNSNYTSSKTDHFENLYNTNYKRYTTYYYGISRDDLKKEKKSVENKKNINTDNSFIKTKSLLLIIVASLFIIIAIICVILLSLLKNYINNSKTLKNNGTANNIININTYLPYITFNMDYFDIRDMIGQPDNFEIHDDGVYGYWGSSYIIFNEDGYVIGWKNNGNVFRTDTHTGTEAQILEEFYNSISE